MTGGPTFFGFIVLLSYFAFIVGVIVAAVMVIKAMRRSARAQEQIADRLAGVEKALTSRQNTEPS